MLIFLGCAFDPLFAFRTDSTNMAIMLSDWLRNLTYKMEVYIALR